MNINVPGFESMRLISPIGEVLSKPISLARRLESLQGKSIGFIDNAKPNAKRFLHFIEELMLEKYPGIRTQMVSKNFTPNYLIADQLERKVDAVVNAWGD